MGSNREKSKIAIAILEKLSFLRVTKIILHFSNIAIGLQSGLRVKTLQGAIEKSPILLLQYWKFESLDGTPIISYFDGSNKIFADCILIIPGPITDACSKVVAFNLFA